MFLWLLEPSQPLQLTGLVTRQDSCRHKCLNCYDYHRHSHHHHYNQHQDHDHDQVVVNNPNQRSSKPVDNAQGDHEQNIITIIIIIIIIIIIVINVIIIIIIMIEQVAAINFVIWLVSFLICSPILVFQVCPFVFCILLFCISYFVVFILYFAFDW